MNQAWKHSPTALLLGVLMLAWWLWPGKDGVPPKTQLMAQDPAALLRDQAPAAGGAANAAPPASAASQART
ncbi:hypothetical protein [Inhella sp.]|uniref:hypothetical protein n=1 Tax=Inhella sp. TaxID=1921806 RepID=UPI0035AF06D1